jgi:hypothetical protein
VPRPGAASFSVAQRLYATQLPSFFNEKFDVEVVLLGGGIGELEALTKSGDKQHRLSPGWSSLLVEMLNEHYVDAATSHVAAAYWEVSNASFEGLLVRVRTALAELVAELIALTPQDQEVPDKLAADQATQLVVTGDRPTINYAPQHATSGGTNVTVGTPASGPVTVSGANGTTIGSQTASGANSSVVGSQAVQGDHNAISGREATNTGSAEPLAEEGWWARLRKRGMVVAFSTIIGGIATAVGAVVAVFTWLGWTPWS